MSQKRNINLAVLVGTIDTVNDNVLKKCSLNISNSKGKVGNTTNTVKC